MKKIKPSQKNRFRKEISYTIDEIAFICDKKRRTVERWIRNGLAPCDPTTKPYYFMGDAVTMYLRKMRKSRKWDMSGGSYTCFSCGKGVQAKEKSIRKIRSMYHAKCKNCGGNICKTIGKAHAQIRAP